jgi:hypothetical protein
MPSPFPGMDPYLEHPVRWPGLHHRLIGQISDALNAVLPPQYIADIGERLYVVQGRRSIYPDAFLIERPLPAPPVGPTGGSTAVLAASDPPLVITAQPEERREAFVEIIAAEDQSQVVTVIEVLSPTNKAAGSEGRRQYLEKQSALLASQTHLIEIDLLRQGEYTVAAPRDGLLTPVPWDYLVSLHRGRQCGQFAVWPIPLRERLPRIDVPLADADPDVVLDLQAVFSRSYDQGPYARRVDYRQDPPAPLRRADAEWADELLRQRGLRA